MCQKFYWLVLVVQGTLAYRLSPITCGMRGFSPYNSYSPFTQMVDDQWSFDGNQNEIPLPLSLFLPSGANGLLQLEPDFCNFGPFGSPTLERPSCYGCMRRPFEPIGNLWPMSTPVALQLDQNSGNCQRLVYEDPTATFIDYYEEKSGGKKDEQKGKGTQYSSRCSTTKKPSRRTGNKILIV